MRYQYINNPNAQVTLVFIYGWCMGTDSFYQQVEYFKQQYSILLPEYSTIIIQDAANNDDLFATTISSINKLIRHHASKNVILVGHSMGGVMSLSLMQQLTNIVIGCVLIETTVPSSNEQRRLFNDFITSLKGTNKDEVLDKFIDNRMINHKIDDIPLVEQKKHDMLLQWRQSPERFMQLLSEAVLFDSEKALAECIHPLMYIAGEPSSGNLPAIQTLNPQIIIKQLSSGHFIMLNLPRQLNVVLQSFFTQICPIS